MQMSRLAQGDPSVAVGLELDVIAAVVIGGASLSGGTGSILGSMIGALIMGVLRNGSNMSDWPNYMQEIIIGIVIILAVALDRLRQRRHLLLRIQLHPPLRIQPHHAGSCDQPAAGLTKHLLHHGG
jgi:ribose/xylose/arabinose/galactoside ABC-type transport system permease subunit